MLRVNDFRNYITTIKEAIDALTFSETVMDDSQLAKFLDVRKLSDCIILGIIPEHKPNGSADNLKSRDLVSILVLRKVSRQDQTHSEFLDNIHFMQEIAKQVSDKLLDDFEDENDCGFMRYLEPASFKITPIWALNSCDGYQIDFSLNTTF